jgi:hypothetical protein
MIVSIESLNYGEQRLHRREMLKMHFLSPERPTLSNGAPAYPFDAPIAALPGIRIYPATSGFRLELMLVISTDRTATNFTKFVETALHAVDIIDAYVCDPEAVMGVVFGWPGVSERQARLPGLDEPGTRAVPRPRKVSGRSTSLLPAAIDALPDDDMGV